MDGLKWSLAEKEKDSNAETRHPEPGPPVADLCAKALLRDRVAPIEVLEAARHQQL